MSSAQIKVVSLRRTLYGRIIDVNRFNQKYEFVVANQDIEPVIKTSCDSHSIFFQSKNRYIHLILVQITDNVTYQ